MTCVNVSTCNKITEVEERAVRSVKDPSSEQNESVQTNLIYKDIFLQGVQSSGILVTGLIDSGQRGNDCIILAILGWMGRWNPLHLSRDSIQCVSYYFFFGQQDLVVIISRIRLVRVRCPLNPRLAHRKHRLVVVIIHIHLSRQKHTRRSQRNSRRGFVNRRIRLQPQRAQAR